MPYLALLFALFFSLTAHAASESLRVTIGTAPNSLTLCVSYIAYPECESEGESRAIQNETTSTPLAHQSIRLPNGTVVHAFPFGDTLGHVDGIAEINGHLLVFSERHVWRYDTAKRTLVLGWKSYHRVLPPTEQAPGPYLRLVNRSRGNTRFRGLLHIKESGEFSEFQYGYNTPIQRRPERIVVEGNFLRLISEPKNGRLWPDMLFNPRTGRFVESP